MCLFLLLSIVSARFCSCIFLNAWLFWLSYGHCICKIICRNNLILYFFGKSHIFFYWTSQDTITKWHHLICIWVWDDSKIQRVQFLLKYTLVPGMQPFGISIQSRAVHSAQPQLFPRKSANTLGRSLSYRRSRPGNSLLPYLLTGAFK